jgi:hypothetical protein
MVKALGFSALIILFYVPGGLLGAASADFLGPRWCIVIGASIQAAFCLALGLAYEPLSKNIAAFVLVFGLFLTFGEFGLGDNIAVYSAKSSPTCVRGRFYGMAAAMGKLGAFIGTYVFPLVSLLQSSLI